MPTILKILIGGVPIAIAIVWFIKIRIEGSLYEKQFFKNKLNSIVVGPNPYYGRTVEYHLNNGFTIYFTNPINDKIRIGDSIIKKPNSYLYNVYRMGLDGSYKYWATYDFQNID